jgi:hypothetical protein
MTIFFYNNMMMYIKIGVFLFLFFSGYEQFIIQYRLLILN